MIQDLFFYVLSFGILLSTISVIVARNPVHSVLFLILAFFNAAGLFLLTGAEYLAMSLIIIYVGAVAVLFLFVVMMLDIKFSKFREGFVKYLSIALVFGILLFIDIYVAINKSSIPLATINHFNEHVSNTHQLGLILYTDYIYLFQISGMILLIAMIGSIVLTHRIRSGVKKQNSAKQLDRNKENSIELVKVKAGKGVDI